MPATKLRWVDSLPDSDPPEKSGRRVHPPVRRRLSTTRSSPSIRTRATPDAITIVANAMKKAGTDGKALRAAIEQTKGYVGVSGVYNLTAEDHNGLDVDSMVMVQVKNGKFVPAQ